MFWFCVIHLQKILMKELCFWAFQGLAFVNLLWYEYLISLGYATSIQNASPGSWLYCNRSAASHQGFTLPKCPSSTQNSMLTLFSIWVLFFKGKWACEHITGTSATQVPVMIAMASCMLTDKSHCLLHLYTCHCDHLNLSATKTPTHAT